jgi:hypothetical protein
VLSNSGCSSQISDPQPKIAIFKGSSLVYRSAHTHGLTIASPAHLAKRSGKKSDERARLLTDPCYTRARVPRRDPDLLSQYLCRFCGERIAWGVILRVLRVDPDTPG